MKLLKDLGTRLINGTWIRYAIFECSFCFQEVEKRFYHGIKQKSCGCIKIKHGGYDTKLYKVWDSIKQRILNPNNKSYKNYGGRGITICPEWLEFASFKNWALSNGYKNNLVIDRINNGRGYCPENCHFTTSKENNRNTRHCKITLEIANEIRTLHATGNYTQRVLAIKYNVSNPTINLIIKNKYWKI